MPLVHLLLGNRNLAIGFRIYCGEVIVLAQGHAERKTAESRFLCATRQYDLEKNEAAYFARKWA